MHRIAVSCGYVRDVKHMKRHYEFITMIHSFTGFKEMVYGGTDMASRVAARWCVQRRGIIRPIFVPTLWQVHGEKTRDVLGAEIMATQPEGLIVFAPTAKQLTMCAIARDMGIPIFEMERSKWLAKLFPNS